MKRETPGPWTYVGIRPSKIENGVVSVDLDAPYEFYSVRRVYEDERGRCTQMVADVVVTRGHEAEAEPTARLIAAAPDLLAALKRAEGHVFTSCALDSKVKSFRDDLEFVRVAIAKAEGH